MPGPATRHGRLPSTPNSAYGNPGTSPDGLRTADWLDMLNGSVHRYDWKLVAKREMCPPDNSCRLHGGDLAFHAWNSHGVAFFLPPLCAIPSILGILRCCLVFSRIAPTRA